MSQTPLKIAVLPDVQVKPRQSLSFLKRIGKYFAYKKPDVIVCMGDFADVASLNSFDKGKKTFEGRRYEADKDITRKAMFSLMFHIRAEIAKGVWKPRLVMLLGNHEARADRAVEDRAEFAGLLGTKDFADIYKEYGWEVHPFLQPVRINDVMFSHYFTSGVMGRPITTAGALLTKKHMSCVAGHQQGKQIAYATRADGSTITGMIVGSCYEHNEDYLGPQGNKHWRGLVMLHEVKNGSFDEMFVSLGYINKKYGGLK